MLSRSHNVVEAFAKLLRKRQALMPKMVVAGHLAITFLLSLLFLRARSAFTSPRLPHRIAGDTSKWVVSAQTIVVVASLNFRKTPKGLPTFSLRSTYQDTSIDGVTRVLAGLGTGRIHRCAVCNRGSCNAITCWIPDHRRIVTAPRLGGSDTRSFSPSVFLSLSVPFFLSILLYFLLLSLSLCFSFSPSVSLIFCFGLCPIGVDPVPVRNVQREMRFGLQTFRAKWKRNNIMVIGALSQRGKLAASVS